MAAASGDARRTIRAFARISRCESTTTIRFRGWPQRANVHARRRISGTMAPRTCSRHFGSDYNGPPVERRATWLARVRQGYYSFGRGYEDVDFQGGGLPGVQSATGWTTNEVRNSNVAASFVVGRLEGRLHEGNAASPRCACWSGTGPSPHVRDPAVGQPITIGAGKDRYRTDSNNDRAALVGNAVLDSRPPST